MELSLKDAVFGSKIKIRVPRLVRCDSCNGSGAAKGAKPTICSHCNGAGQIRMQQGFFSMQQTCNYCRGKGQIIKDVCNVCNGSSSIEQEKTLSVNIPAGVDSGDRVRLSGEGNWAQNAQPGDLFVAVSIRDHPLFSRDGKDLFIEMPIPFDIAITGGSITIPTLEKPIQLKIPENTQTGKIFRARGKGASSVRSKGRGDLLCRVIVEVPTNLNAEQKQNLKSLKESLDQKTNFPLNTKFDAIIKSLKD